MLLSILVVHTVISMSRFSFSLPSNLQCPVLAEKITVIEIIIHAKIVFSFLVGG